MEDTMTRIVQEMKVFDFIDMTDVDGLKFYFEDSWVLIRPSGTEPKIRVSIETKNGEKMKGLWTDVMEIVKRCAS
jgi:phosphomannomutase